jgi:endonuclease-3
MKQDSIRKIFTILRKNNPQPTTELQYNSAFELLIAVILSAQATDISVNNVTKELFKVANTPTKMLTLGITKLKNYIKTIGLYNSKASNIIATSQKLLADFAGQVPSTRADLESLPGVGRKTANVLLNTAFGQPVIAVDTHILRVSKRIGFTNEHMPRAVEEDLERIIPIEFKQYAHHWLILHGRYVCKARRPLCAECAIASLCEYPDKKL